VSFLATLRRDKNVLASVATVAALAADLGLGEAAALLDAQIAEATRRERCAAERADALAHALRTFWGADISMNARARQLARDLDAFRRFRRARGGTNYEAALGRIASLFDGAPVPSARTILRLSSRASD
jgi:hypothetical protein